MLNPNSMNRPYLLKKWSSALNVHESTQSGEFLGGNHYEWKSFSQFNWIQMPITTIYDIIYFQELFSYRIAEVAKYKYPNWQSNSGR